MANVIKKHSISFELAQKMVNAAVKKAKELGVSENVVILDDGGNLKAFTRMDGAPILCIEMAQNKAYTALICAGSSVPEATTIGMCINDGVDLIAFSTSNPDTLGRDRSRKMRSGIGTSSYLPSRRT